MYQVLGWMQTNRNIIIFQYCYPSFKNHQPITERWTALWKKVWTVPRTLSDLQIHWPPLANKKWIWWIMSVMSIIWNACKIETVTCSANKIIKMYRYILHILSPFLNQSSFKHKFFYLCYTFLKVVHSLLLVQSHEISANSLALRSLFLCESSVN